MARPMKNKVDYFPHVTRTGKTIAILEARWGNDGYAFWFKVLELLGSSEGFSYDCNKPADWEYLLSKTRVTEDTANAILKKLAEIDAIDAGLWRSGIIWSDNFAANLGPVFDKRKTAPPEKPEFPARKCGQTGVSVPASDGNPASAEFPVPETDKVKESIAEQTEGEETKATVGGAGEADAGKTKRKPKPPKSSCPSKLREGVIQQADTVYLKPDEVEKLARDYGEAGLARIVELLDAYKTNHPTPCAKYRDDYKVITAWVAARYREEQGGRRNASRASPAHESFAMQKLAAMAREAAEDDAR